MATVKFTSGEEREYAADGAALSDPLFVLYIYNRERQELESVDTFPVEQVAWAKFPDGRIVIGKGTVEPAP
jgi:hypothetical protein